MEKGVGNLAFGIRDEKVDGWMKFIKISWVYHKES